MRTLRIEKLAEFKKMALNEASTSGRDDYHPEEEENVRYKKLVDEIFADILNGYKDVDKDVIKDVNSLAKYFADKMTLKKDKYRLVGPFDPNGSNFKSIAMPQVQILLDSIKSLNNTGSAKATSKSSGPQATRGVTKLDAPPGTKLQELSGEVVYNYLISGPLEFSYFTGKTPEDKTNKGSSKKVTSAYSKWEQAAKTLNTLWATSVKATSTPAATAAPATAPAAATEAATQTATEVPTDVLTTNVARLLSNVDAGQTYAGRTPFTNEMGMVRNMLKAINAIADQKNAVIDAPLSLAKIIVGANRSSLGRSALSTYDTTALTSMKEREIEQTFRTELDIIMRSVVSFDQRLGGKKNYNQISRYINLRTPAAPPTEKRSILSFDKKFVKAATLRRLKIRSQMEAAIDSSAQMGRARVS